MIRTCPPPEPRRPVARWSSGRARRRASSGGSRSRRAEHDAASRQRMPLGLDLAECVVIPGPPDVPPERGRLVDGRAPLGRMAVGAGRADVQEPPDPRPRRRAAEILGRVEATRPGTRPRSPSRPPSPRHDRRPRRRGRPDRRPRSQSGRPERARPRAPRGTSCRSWDGPAPGLSGPARSAARRCGCPAFRWRPSPGRTKPPSFPLLARLKAASDHRPDSRNANAGRCVSGSSRCDARLEMGLERAPLVPARLEKNFQGISVILGVLLEVCRRRRVHDLMSGRARASRGWRGDSDSGAQHPGTTMPEETIDPGLLEQTKNQIRKLVAEIADLAESDIQPAEFYVEFLNRAVAAVAASGGAFWMLDGRGSLKLQHQLEFRLTGLLDGRAKTQPHDALAGVHDPGVAAADHPAGGDDRGGAQRGQPDAVRADHRAADGGQAGGRADRDPDGPDPPRGDAEEHAPVRQRPLRPGGQLPQEPPDAADDVAAAALEPARGVHPPDPRLARPEGDGLRRRQRRQAAGRLRPAERRPEDRRPGRWSRRSAARRSSSSGPT